MQKLGMAATRATAVMQGLRLNIRYNKKRPNNVFGGALLVNGLMKTSESRDESNGWVKGVQSQCCH